VPPTVAWQSMQSQETPRLLFVHAHPDDETLTTGATIAHYVTRGAEVYVVTCTLGEEGEVIGERYRQLAVDAADQLGGYRVGELTTALRALGVAEPIFLGGAGRWRDSGMAGTPPRHWQRFVDADIRESIGELVAIIRQLRPHVVVTYDPKGGYGHPDHVHAHEVTMAAVAASGRTDNPGKPWAVPKVYWTVMSKSAMGAGLDALDDVPPDWRRVSIDEVPFGYPDDAIDARRSRRCVRTRLRSPSPRTAGPAPCRTTSRCRSGQSSTTSLRRAHPASATIAGGKPICWPGSTWSRAMGAR
jgi:N-acetyl-1-D-myo-inositol-2-amino-2-deoxy-alpha-D-glucopyranoside deacetylase